MERKEGKEGRNKGRKKREGKEERREAWKEGEGREGRKEEGREGKNRRDGQPSFSILPGLPLDQVPLRNGFSQQ